MVTKLVNLTCTSWGERRVIVTCPSCAIRIEWMVDKFSDTEATLKKLAEGKEHRCHKCNYIYLLRLRSPLQRLAKRLNSEKNIL